MFIQGRQFPRATAVVGSGLDQGFIPYQPNLKRNIAMALADPQSVTINAVANVLPRTGLGLTEGTFTKSDGNLSLRVRHASAKRVRHEVRLDFRKVAQDVLQPALNVASTGSVVLYVDVPKVGFSESEIKQYVDGLTAFLTASSGAAVTKIIGGES